MSSKEFSFSYWLETFFTCVAGDMSKFLKYGWQGWFEISFNLSSKEKFMRNQF